MKSKIAKLTLFLIVVGITFLGTTYTPKENPYPLLDIYCKQSNCVNNSGVTHIHIIRNGKIIENVNSNDQGFYGTAMENGAVFTVVIFKDGSEGCKSDITMPLVNYQVTVCLEEQCGNK